MTAQKISSEKEKAPTDNVLHSTDCLKHVEASMPSETEKKVKERVKSKWGECDNLVEKLVNIEFIHSRELSDAVKESHKIEGNCIVEVAIRNEEPKVIFTPLRTSVLRRIKGNPEKR